MAPHAKRPAAAAAGPSKKQKNDTKKQLGLIQEALGEAPLDRSVQMMLQKAVPSTLPIYADVRHPYQVTCVDMISQALVQVQKAKEAEKTAAQAKVDGMESERSARDATVISCQSGSTAAKEAHKEKEQAAEAAGAAHKEAKRASKDAEASQKAGEKEIASAGATKAILEAAQAKTAQLKEESGSSSCIKEVLAAAKKGDCDENLLKTLPEVLSKAPADRGTFDGTAYVTLVEFFAKAVGEATARVSQSDAKRAALEKAVEDANQSVKAESQTSADADKALTEASHADKEAADALKAADKAVKSFVTDQKAAATALKESTNDLDSFMTGALLNFQELRDKATPAPEPEQPEEAAAPDAAPEAAA